MTRLPWPDSRSEVRALVRTVLGRSLPFQHAAILDREGRFDRSVWKALGNAGLLGFGAPEDLGGSGGSVSEAVTATEEIARVLPSLAVDYVVTGMAMRLLGTETLDAAVVRSLQEVACGDQTCAFALSEPDSGTDLLSLRTTARLEGDIWVLNGRKAWISLAGEAGIMFVLCSTEGRDVPRGRAMSLIAVPTDQPGVTTQRTHLASMRAAMTYEVILDDAWAPAGHLVGDRGRGLMVLSRSLDVERLMAAAISLGIGCAALDLHVSYARDRITFGRPIGTLQAVQHPAADSHAELAAARALVEQCVAAIHAGHEARELSAMAKLVAAETTQRVVDRAARAMGAMGLAEESPMQMYLRDARLQLFSPISNEMVRNLLAEVLGLPRSY